MPSFNFVGPTYQSRSLAVDSERAVNLFCELVESGNDASRGTRWYLLGTPGKYLLCNLAGGPIAAIAWGSSSILSQPAAPAIFAIAGATLYSVTLAWNGSAWVGTPTSLGTVDSQAIIGAGSQLFPAQIICISPVLLFVVAHGKAYVVAFGSPITAFTFGPGAVPATSGGQGYAVGDTGIVLGSNGLDATYVVTAISAVLAGAIGTISGPNSANPPANTLYAVGDTGTVAGGNGDATYVVDFVGSGSQVLPGGFHLTNQGSGYAPANNVAMIPGGAQPGTGTGFTINILSVAASGGAVTGLTVTNGSGYALGNNLQTARGGAQPGVGFGLAINVTAIGAAVWKIARQTIPAGPNPDDNYIRYATYMDGYIIVNLAPNEADPMRRQFFISGLNDPSSWDPLDVGAKEGNPDPSAAVFAAYEALMVFGETTTEIWYDNPTGAAFPFQRIQGGGLIECGLASPWTVVKMDGTVVWLGTDNRGGFVVWELRGMTPTRISNHAVENAIENYDPAGASAFSYQEEGHFFYVLHFPIPNATWVADTSAIGPDGKPMWHERLHWNGSMWNADIGRYHAFVPDAGAHVVGDPNSGNLYIQSLDTLTDNGTAIRRLRASPHLTDEKRRTLFSRFRLFMQTGVNVPATGAGSAPIVNLRLSDDGGYTFGPYLTTSAGKIGEIGLLVEWYRMGLSRNRVYEVTIEEPIPIAFVDAFSEAIPTVTR